MCIDCLNPKIKLIIDLFFIYVVNLYLLLLAVVMNFDI